MIEGGLDAVTVLWVILGPIRVNMVRGMVYSEVSYISLECSSTFCNKLNFDSPYRLRCL